ncbi:MAG: hypothetical protein ACO3JG_00420 [Luteolibacter sp.]
MNSETIGTLGQLGLACGAGSLLCALIYWVRKRRSLARMAAALACAALACTLLHSATHVSRIEVDPSAKLAEMEARQQAKRQAVLDSRGTEVAQIRFAEDDGGEFLDKAGLEQSDLKYLESIETDDVPEWKKSKKTRSDESADDVGLEDQIDTEEAEGGADVGELAETARSEPILMSEAGVITARRIDRWSRRSAWALAILALLLLFHDYLRRANRYAEASLPLPLPSSWLNAVTPVPPALARPDPPRRPVPAELAWLARRGDAFVYLTESPEAAEAAMQALRPFSARRGRPEVIRVSNDDSEIDDDFIFDAVWFGRASFIIDSAGRAQRLLERFAVLLGERRARRARVRQTSHLVRDLEQPMPATVHDSFMRLTQATGFSLFLCR